MINDITKCTDCIGNDFCKRPYSADISIQLQYFGRTYTKAEWDQIDVSKICPSFEQEMT